MRPPSLWLARENNVQMSEMLKEYQEWVVENIYCIKYLHCLYLPGYLPPLFLWMKQMIRRIKMSNAMAHIRPMNHPWVAISTCLLATASGERGRISIIIHNGNILTSVHQMSHLVLRELPLEVIIHGHDRDWATRVRQAGVWGRREGSWPPGLIWRRHVSCKDGELKPL